jgi:hypothetical protein
MYQIDLIKRDLLRNLPILFPDVYEEIVQAYSGMSFPLYFESSLTSIVQIISRIAMVAGMCFHYHVVLLITALDWVSVPALHSTMRVVARASNMIFVGSTVCRNEEYLTRCISFAKSLMAARAIINTFPNFLKPYVNTMR